MYYPLFSGTLKVEQCNVYSYHLTMSYAGSDEWVDSSHINELWLVIGTYPAFSLVKILTTTVYNRRQNYGHKRCVSVFYSNNVCNSITIKVATNNIPYNFTNMQNSVF